MPPTHTADTSLALTRADLINLRSDLRESLREDVTSALRTELASAPKAESDQRKDEAEKRSMCRLTIFMAIVIASCIVFTAIRVGMRIQESLG